MNRRFVAAGAACAVATLMAVTFTGSPGYADEAGDTSAQDSTTTPTPAGLEPGDSVVVTGDQIDDTRDDVADGTVVVPPAEDRSMTHDLVNQAADQGIYVAPDAVDVLPLLDGNALLALPSDLSVDSLTVSLSDDGVMSADMETSNTTDADVEVAGPQMASKWADNGDGAYTLKIISQGTTMADGRFTWRRYKLTNDGDPQEVNYLYKRWGDIQPADLGGQPDPKVMILRIQSFPYDSIEKDLRSWNAYSPANDRDDNCNDYSASIAAFGLSVTVPFSAGCGKYNMWRNVDKPSSYWLQYEGGGYGNREVGYVTSWSQKQGTTGSMHDLQQIVIDFRFPSPNPQMACTQTDASRTCDGHS